MQLFCQQISTFCETPLEEVSLFFILYYSICRTSPEGAWKNLFIYKNLFLYIRKILWINFPIWWNSSKEVTPYIEEKKIFMVGKTWENVGISTFLGRYLVRPHFRIDIFFIGFDFILQISTFIFGFSTWNYKFIVEFCNLKSDFVNNCRIVVSIFEDLCSILHLYTSVVVWLSKRCWTHWKMSKYGE